MLFRKKIERSCSYCMHGTKIDDELVLCTKKGVVAQNHSCWKFKYDPTKRIPAKPKALDFSKYDEEDYTL